MGKNKVCRLCVFRCVLFNLLAGTDSTMVYTDLYLSKNCNTVTLTWCTFGGNATTDQKSTTAQNKKIPCEFLPSCDQTFLIPGKDEANGARVMKLTITRSGEITFTFSISGEETATFPVFDGSSVSWISFNDCDPCGGGYGGYGY